MNRITVSAPGKLMLLGEHAVVYGRPCIVTAVDQRMFLTAELISGNFLEITAPDVKVTKYKKPLEEVGEGDIPKGVQFVEYVVRIFKRNYGLKNGIRIKTQSDFSSKFGFGSSSASTVTTVFALAELYNKKLSKKQIFDLSYKTILDIQGKGSGFDVAASIWGGTLYFQNQEGRIKNQDLQIDSLPLIVGYTGRKSDTVTLVNQVAQKRKNNPDQIRSLMDSIWYIVDEAKDELKKKNWEKVGELMNDDQKRLEVLGVSSKKLDALINAAVTNGAYGAKLSGAGGGDCMIALYPENKKKQIGKAIEKAGGKVLDVAIGAEGVRVENKF